MRRHNGMRCQLIDDIIWGLDVYYFEKNTKVDSESRYKLAKDDFKKSLDEWKITFDLEGGVVQWFRNRDGIMKKEKRHRSNFLGYIVDNIDKASMIDEYGVMSYKEITEIFCIFLDNGIYDNIFLSFDDVVKCMESLNYAISDRFVFIEHNSQQGYLDKKNVLTLIGLLKERIRKVFTGNIV